jgi:hypothetical protein
MSGYPRGTKVLQVTFEPNSKVETLPRPRSVELIAFASQPVFDARLKTSFLWWPDQACANTFCGS